MENVQKIGETQLTSSGPLEAGKQLTRGDGKLWQYSRQPTVIQNGYDLSPLQRLCSSLLQWIKNYTFFQWKVDCPFTCSPFTLPGELPAPEIYLNVSSAQVGDSLSMRCLPPDTRTSAFFFCRNGHPIASRKALPSKIAYTLVFEISEQSAGQYSCGYQKKDRSNQKNSAFSAVWNLTVLHGKTTEMFRVGKGHEPYPSCVEKAIRAREATPT